MITKVISPRITSPGARTLANVLNIKRLRTTSNYNLANRAVINWGCGSHRNNSEQATHIINKPSSVANSIDKSTFLSLINPEHALETTTSYATAEEWLENGSKVIGRTLTKSFGGRGIVVLASPDDLEQHTNIKLFTKYFNGRYEYRIHVGKMPNGTFKTITIQRKGKTQPELDQHQGMIRNVANGYTYVRGIDNLIPSDLPHEHLDKAVHVCNEALEACQLDFAAFDLRISLNGKIKIIEANTAPGLHGTTIEEYKSFFSTYLQQL